MELVAVCVSVEFSKNRQPSLVGKNLPLTRGIPRPQGWATMSFEMVGLGKLLGAMYASKSLRTRLIRDDIRRDLSKLAGGGPSGGGDFYVPFWADAKRHVSGKLDLRIKTLARVESNKQTRQRLYPLLRDGFLLWWEEKRRQRNVPFSVIEDHIKARVPLLGLGTVKVENTLSFTVGEEGHRVVYPYFMEEPVLCAEAARIGLWLMSQCIEGFAPDQLRILDVLRSRSFSIIDEPFHGNEQMIFEAQYGALLHEWRSLKSEYA